MQRMRIYKQQARRTPEVLNLCLRGSFLTHVAKHNSRRAARELVRGLGSREKKKTGEGSEHVFCNRLSSAGPAKLQACQVAGRGLPRKRQLHRFITCVWHCIKWLYTACAHVDEKVYAYLSCYAAKTTCSHVFSNPHLSQQLDQTFETLDLLGVFGPSASR